MEAYDLHVHASPFGGESSAEDMIDFAKRLGWSGIVFCCFADSVEIIEQQRRIVNSLKTKDFDVAMGVEIKANSGEELHSAIDRTRRKAEMLIVSGGSLDINRAALETNQVDMLSHPENQRNDSGIDLVMAKLAADNNVSIELNFREALNSYRKSRVHVLSHMRHNLKLAKKFGFPLAITSGAYSKWELRAPRELAAFGINLGMRVEETFQSLASSRVETNRQKSDQNWIVPGVKVDG